MRAPTATSSRAGLKSIKWTAGDFASAGDALPMGAPGVEWSFGDVDAGLAPAKYVLDESFVTAALSHHCLEPRSCMAYWQGDKVFVYGSTQSQTAVMPNLARLAGVEPDDLVYIAEYLRRRLRLEDQRLSRRWACRSTWRRKPACRC